MVYCCSSVLYRVTTTTTTVKTVNSSPLKSILSPRCYGYKNGALLLEQTKATKINSNCLCFVASCLGRLLLLVLCVLCFLVFGSQFSGVEVAIGWPPCKHISSWSLMICGWYDNYVNEAFHGRDPWTELFIFFVFLSILVLDRFLLTSLIWRRYHYHGRRQNVVIHVAMHI